MTRCSCWHQNFVPKGLLASAPRLYICIRSWKKKMYKIRFQRDCFETCSKWPKWQEVSVVIKILAPGVVCPWSAAIYFQVMMTLAWPWPFLWQGQICYWYFCMSDLIEHWVLLYFQVCSNSAYPQHSGERYRTNGPLVFMLYWYLYYPYSLPQHMTFSDLQPKLK